MEAPQWLKSLRAKLPWAKTPEEKEKRTELFKAFDPNSNGYLSLAEVDKGLCEIIADDLEGQRFEAKPAIIKAFNAAKDVAPSKSSLGEDYVERLEFRLLLENLLMFFELYVLFDALDSSDDRRVDKEEFREALNTIADWGLSVEDVDATFDMLDTNQGGKILFDEFANWALKQRISLTLVGNDDEDK